MKLSIYLCNRSNAVILRNFSSTRCTDASSGQVVGGCAPLYHPWSFASAALRVLTAVATLLHNDFPPVRALASPVDGHLILYSGCKSPTAREISKVRIFIVGDLVPSKKHILFMPKPTNRLQ